MEKTKISIIATFYNLEDFSNSHLQFNFFFIEKVFPYPERNKNMPTPMGAKMPKNILIAEEDGSLIKYNTLIQ